MSWPWEFLDLTHEERQARRLVLDRYGCYGALLAASPALVMLIVRIGLWALAFLQAYIGTYRLAPGSPGSAYSSSASSPSTARYNAVPDSPSLKSRRLTARGSWETWFRRAKWWMSDDVVVLGQRWGQRDQWAVGSLWLAVLLVLCTVETGRDYMHLTKRFGIVGISQLPLQYILALRHVNPLLAIFRTSHEQINRWHRVLGAVVYTLLSLHTVFYLNYFAWTAESFWHRLLRPVIALGIAAFVSMTALNTTALGFVRRWSYRLFFITHVIVAFSVPVLVLFHAHHAQYYVAAALLLLIADLTLRKIHTATTQARIDAIPGTQLVRLTAPIPFSKIDLFRRHPASHVYMSLPHSARPTTNLFSLGYWLFEFLFNPFTIASVNEQTSDLTLVMRTRKGPMSNALTRYARLGSSPKEAVSGDGEDEFGDDDGADDDEATPAIPIIAREDLDAAAIANTANHSTAGSGSIPVNLEGPYGTTAYFPELTPQNFDRVLLVAGGVGATFVVPLYRSIVDEAAAAATAAAATSSGDMAIASPLKADLVWSVRGAGDATWAAVSGDRGDGSGAHSLLEDRNVHIFLTSDSGIPTGNGRANGSAAETAIELTALRRNAAPTSTSASANRFAPAGHMRQRPDLRQIVDDVFRHGNEERVAVVVCGPEVMVQDLRAAVAGWVHKGRSVWWHNETFGW